MRLESLSFGISGAAGSECVEESLSFGISNITRMGLPEHRLNVDTDRAADEGTAECGPAQTPNDTEGFDTLDLKEAKALLDELSP